MVFEDKREHAAGNTEREEGWIRRPQGRRGSGKMRRKEINNSGGERKTGRRTEVRFVA